VGVFFLNTVYILGKGLHTTSSNLYPSEDLLFTSSACINSPSKIRERFHYLDGVTQYRHQCGIGICRVEVGSLDLGFVPVDLKTEWKRLVVHYFQRQDEYLQHLREYGNVVGKLEICAARGYIVVSQCVPLCMPLCASVYVYCLCLSVCSTDVDIGWLRHIHTVSLYVCLCVCVCDSTKQMIVDVVRCQKSGDSLVDVLRRSVTPDEVSHLTPVLPVHTCRHAGHGPAAD